LLFRRSGVRPSQAVLKIRYPKNTSIANERQDPLVQSSIGLPTVKPAVQGSGLRSSLARRPNSSQLIGGCPSDILHRPDKNNSLDGGLNKVECCRKVKSPHSFCHAPCRKRIPSGAPISAQEFCS
jgi:hypothetical protein